MTDIFTKQQRSYNMSRVRSKNTKPEKTVFKFLRESRYKFRTHYDIAGKPDIAFPKEKLVIFIDGEFWHGRHFDEWKNKLTPFWLKKISDNIKRDKKIRKALKAEGWKILRLWDKEISKNQKKSCSKVMNFLRKYSG